MPKSNYYNFDKSMEWDQHIYRIMKQEHVLALFNTNKNVMSKFGNWKDGFENFLMKCGHEVDGVKCDNTVREKMVAQCWTTEKFSEAMWGIYANDKGARFLRVRSTPRKLLDGLKKAHPRLCNELCCIGKVTYKSTSDLKSYYDSNKSAEVTTEMLLRSLLLKRKSFKHEREVRLIYCGIFKQYDSSGLHRYDVDPHSMVTQIMADPNRNPRNWENDRDKIMSTTGYTGEIKRSKIYDAPNW